jgi:hypothetical protein
MSSHTRDRSESGYFEWQSPIGEFGGRANLGKFAPWIPGGSTVLDVGCGGDIS